MTHRLTLKPQPDGFGFLYSTFVDHAGDTHSVNIMPPLPHWRGDMKMSDEYAPHATDCVAFIDGEEVARVRARDDLAITIGKQLLLKHSEK